MQVEHTICKVIEYHPREDKRFKLINNHYIMQVERWNKLSPSQKKQVLENKEKSAKF